MNFSSIPINSRLGRILRAPLRLIPPDLHINVVQGPLRGCRWIAGSSTHGCWLGSYEHEKVRVFAETVRAGDIVFDVGAHVGYYTLLASILVGDQGRTVAFEPLSRNLQYLREHLRMNRVRNVTVVEAAVIDRSGSIGFAEGVLSSMGHVKPGDTSLRVPAVVLDELVLGGQLPPPRVVKLDIEGAEWLALLGARKVLARHGPLVFLALHGAQQRAQCFSLLETAGYGLRPLDGRRMEDTEEVLASASW